MMNWGTMQICQGMAMVNVRQEQRVLVAGVQLCK